MSDSKKLLVITHPVLWNIEDDEIEHALPESQRAAGWKRVDVVPVRAPLADSHQIDWRAALEAQERLFVEEVQPHLRSHRRAAYFGLAPIPLALHLGYRIGRFHRMDVYQRHHLRMDWAYMPEAAGGALPAMKPLLLPEHSSTDVGPVVIRVSTSHPIARSETARVVPASLADVDVALALPQEDALSTPEALTQVVSVFSEALGGLNRLFQRATAIHVFIAAPVGMAFRLGTQISPNIYPDVVTYQHWKHGQPPYLKAITLAGGRGVVRSAGKDTSGTASPWPAASGSLLPHEDIQTLVEPAIHAGLADKQVALFAGIDLRLRAQVAEGTSPGDSLLAALAMLNEIGVLPDGSVPLRNWVSNAILLTKPRAEAAVFERILEKLPIGAARQG